MISVKQLAQQVYGTTEVGQGKCQEVGRRLKKAGISTVKISNVTYIDVPETETVFSIFAKIYGQKIKKTELGVITKGTAPESPRWNKPAAEELAITIERLVKTVEKMAYLLAEKDSTIASLQAQLSTKNHRQFSDVVKKAVAVYGD